MKRCGEQWKCDEMSNAAGAGNAKEVRELGLGNYVVEPADREVKVEWLLDRTLEKSPTAIRRGKYAMNAIASMSFDESIAYTESQIALLAMTADAKEGLKAFSEKRKPAWPGKGPSAVGRTD